jgi:hypothetical protein
MDGSAPWGMGQWSTGRWSDFSAAWAQVRSAHAVCGGAAVPVPGYARRGEG